MHHPKRLSVALLLLALLLALGGCKTGGSATGALTPDESPVPDGMPVMYEFYTTS